MNQKLQNQISKKLETLQELLEKVIEVGVINPDDPETWDSDTLYNLVADCQEIIKLLTDQPIKGKYDEFGQPLTKAGICSLVDYYQEENEDF